MSYILDALKKSESEREAVLAGNAPATPAPPANARPNSSRWLPVSLVIGLIAGGAIFFLSGNQPTPAVQPQPEKRAAINPVETEPVAAAPIVENAAVEESPVAKPEPVEPKEIETTPEEVAESRAAVGPGKTRTPSLFELPEEIRMQIPPIMIEGHFFDHNPARRMVVINGAVQREGRHFSGGQLSLDAINAESITLSFGDTTFTMSVYDSWSGDH